ncbi:MAG TPA: hypothetical protein VFO66_10205 [Gemmatimonadaceae bacterium]|nr:hypothetical protein [Gemmatimonadaceae bacterium]
MPTAPLHSAPKATTENTLHRGWIAGIVGFFAIAFVAVLWMVGTQVTFQYRMTCSRGTANCALTRSHLAGSETYGIGIPPGARAEVRVTARKSRSAPRTHLELVNDAERTFLIQYEGDGAHDRAAAAATRLNAFLEGQGNPVLEELEGEGRPSWALIAAIFVFAAAIFAVAAASRQREKPVRPMA